LLGEIDPSRTYSYEYLCFRITDYRPDASPNLTVSGREARHDLRLFVEDVSDAANVRVEDLAEPVHTVEDLARIFNVSSKTIARWREQGLVSRRLIFQGRKRVGFLRSSVERFVAQNRERVKRGERFSQLSEDERTAIVERARRLAKSGGCPSEIARRIARQMGRSVETVRYTLKQFDQKHPESAVFRGRRGPLTADSKRRIFEQYLAGVGVDLLAKRHARATGSIFRVVWEMRANRIIELPLDYMYNPCFDDRAMESEILAPMTDPLAAARRSRPPAGLPPYLAALYEVPLLTREQEFHLFRKFNYLKFRAARLRAGLDPKRARPTIMDEIDRLYDEAVRIKNTIVQANLRLVVSIAKRHVSVSDDFFSLVSDGNMSLIRAVEKFDFARGNKFSTYASWAIMKNFARSIPEEYRHRDRFRSGQDDVFFGRPDDRADQMAMETRQKLREQQVGRILACLDEREQRIIINRFGLDHAREPRTLREVGDEMGVTKERIRQIEARALTKLRMAAQTERLDASE